MIECLNKNHGMKRMIFKKLNISQEETNCQEKYIDEELELLVMSHTKLNDSIDIMLRNQLLGRTIREEILECILWLQNRTEKESLYVIHIQNNRDLINFCKIRPRRSWLHIFQELNQQSNVMIKLQTSQKCIFLLIKNHFNLGGKLFGKVINQIFTDIR